MPRTSAPHLQNLGSRLPNCVAQFLSLISPAVFDRPVSVGWREDERQLQLDLQNAILEADPTSPAALDASSLVEKLSDDQAFHILLIAAEEVRHDATDTKSTERLLALFTSPRDNQILFWDCPGCPSYVWRYGFVQLLPHIMTSPTGGLNASLEHDLLRSSPRHDQYQSDNVTVDLKSKAVDIDSGDSPWLRLSVKSVKCYRMPGSAAKIRKSS